MLLCFSVDDSIQSAPTIGRLAYTMPSLPDLFNGMPMEAFSNHWVQNNGDEAIRFRVKIQNNADNTFMPCPDNIGSKCDIQFRKRYTPMLHDIVPSNVYLDQTLTYYINVMAANYNDVMADDADPVDFIKFSGTRNDYEGMFDASKRLNGYRVDTLQAKSGDQHPGNQVPEVRFRVGNAYLRESAKHCNFAGDDCWYVKTHPKIDSISAATGYKTGGQALTISGWGLKGDSLDDVEVIVDGVPCTVTSSTLEEITCVTGAADSVSIGGVSQPGSPGLTQKVKNTTPYWDLRTDESVDVAYTRFLTNFESYYNAQYTDGVITTGWFKAPETGNYRFYISCDDACELLLDDLAPFSKDDYTAPTLDQKAVRHWTGDWRNYQVPPEEDSSNQYISDWIALEKDEFYQIEGYHMEWTGNDHFSVAVEFE